MKQYVLLLCLGLGILAPKTNIWADDCVPENYPDYGFGADEEVFYMVNGALVPIFFRSNAKGLVIGCRAEASLKHPIAIPKSFFPVEISGCSKYDTNDRDCLAGNKLPIPDPGCYLIGSIMIGVDPVTNYQYTASPLVCASASKGIPSKGPANQKGTKKPVPQKSKEPPKKDVEPVLKDSGTSKK